MHSAYVSGDSMDRLIPENTIISQPTNGVENGKVELSVSTGPETMMKRFYNLDGTVILKPESWNPDYQTIYLKSPKKKPICTLKVA